VREQIRNGYTVPLFALAQNNVTATDHNNRPANHRARARHIRKDQVTDQTGPENINIFEGYRGQAFEVEEAATKECVALRTTVRCAARVWREATSHGSSIAFKRVKPFLIAMMPGDGQNYLHKIIFASIFVQ